MPEETVCYICCEPDSFMNPLAVEKPCLCKSMDIHISCHNKLKATLGQTCKACKAKYPWLPLTGGNLCRIDSEGSQGEKFITLYTIDELGRPHGQAESARVAFEGDTKTDWCDACQCNHTDYVPPGVKSLVQVGNYQHGLRHGTFAMWPITVSSERKYFPENSPLIRVNYVEGVLHGPVKALYSFAPGYYATDKYEFVNGVVQGKRTIASTVYDHFKIECNYRDGLLHGTVIKGYPVPHAMLGYYRITETYVNGLSQGKRQIFRGWGSDWTLVGVMHIKDGELEGPAVLYNEEPGSIRQQVRQRMNYHKGILKGHYQRFDERGAEVESHWFTGESRSEEEAEYAELVNQQVDAFTLEVPPIRCGIWSPVDPASDLGVTRICGSRVYPAGGKLLEMTANDANQACPELKHFHGHISGRVAALEASYEDEYYNSDDDYNSDYWDPRHGYDSDYLDRRWDRREARVDNSRGRY
jgi:antitoxin component YwqK of YwqJK toxin-antitoxin module